MAPNIICQDSSLYSLVIQLPEHTSINNCGRWILDHLICSQLNSKSGLKLSLDTPLNNPAMLNLLRPAVLRQYYGMNVLRPFETNSSVCRYTYGSGTGTSSVGMDPKNFITRKMTEAMECMSKDIYTYIKSHRSELDLDNANLESGFNHCTILLYYAGQSTKENSKLGMHCDCVYSPQDGYFVKKANSQVEGTPTVIYSLGDERSVNWIRRQRGTSDNGREHWIVDETFSSTFKLSSNSLTIANTLDEDPRFVDKQGFKYQYQHGNVNVSGNKFSAGLVFRTVDSIEAYNTDSDIMVVEDQSDIDVVHTHLGVDFNMFHCSLLNLYHNIIF